MKIIICGAGIGGLALGQALKKNGIEFVILEATPAVLPTGYRLHMNADGGNALRYCLPDNLYQAYVKTSRTTPRRHVFSIFDQFGTELGVRPHIGVPNDRTHAHTAVNRLTLREIMTSGIESDIRFNSRLVSYTENDDGVVVHLEDGMQFSGDILVAADGINSAVRRQKLGEPEVVDMGSGPLLYSTVTLSNVNVDSLPPCVFDGFSLAVGVDGREVTFGLFDPREEIVQVAAELLPGSKITPVEPYLQVTMQIPHDGPLSMKANDSVRTASKQQLHEFMVAAVADWHPAFRAAIANVNTDSISPAALKGIRTVEAWDTTRVTLIGDSIHAMPPTFGAGANTALKDASYLAEHLIRAVETDRDVCGQIAQFEEAMRAYAYPIANAAHNPDSKTNPNFLPTPASL